MATFAFLICGAFFLGLLAGQWLTNRRWASNADTFIRTEYKGRIYKVVYADGKSQTMLWPVDGRYDGFVPHSGHGHIPPDAKSPTTLGSAPGYRGEVDSRVLKPQPHDQPDLCPWCGSVRNYSMHFQKHVCDKCGCSHEEKP